MNVKSRFKLNIIMLSAYYALYLYSFLSALIVTSNLSNILANNYLQGVSQVFLHLCGTTISHQENLYTSNVKLLMKVACDKVGVKSKDFYSIYCGKVLDPEQLLSYYQINKDSKIIINPRLRGGWYVINCARLNFRNYFYW